MIKTLFVCMKPILKVACQIESNGDQQSGDQKIKSQARNVAYNFSHKTHYQDKQFQKVDLQDKEQTHVKRLSTTVNVVSSVNVS